MVVEFWFFKFRFSCSFDFFKLLHVYHMLPKAHATIEIISDSHHKHQIGFLLLLLFFFLSVFLIFPYKWRVLGFDQSRVHILIIYNWIVKLRSIKPFLVFFVWLQGWKDISDCRGSMRTIFTPPCYSFNPKRHSYRFTTTSSSPSSFLIA